jgi:hypothetical protein
VLPSHLQSTLTVTPPIPLQATTLYTPQNPVGTSSHQRMKNPATQLNPTGQIPNPPLVEKSLRGETILQHTNLTGGKPPLTGHIPVATQPMAGGQSQPSFTGNPPQSWGPPQGGQFHQPHQGGPSNPNPARRNPKSQSFWTTFWTTFPRSPESHLGSSRSIIFSSPRAKSLPSSRST